MKNLKLVLFGLFLLPLVSHADMTVVTPAGFNSTVSVSTHGIHWPDGTIQVSSPPSVAANPFNQSLNTTDDVLFGYVNTDWWGNANRETIMYDDGSGGLSLGDPFSYRSNTTLFIDTAGNIIDLGSGTNAKVISSTVSANIVYVSTLGLVNQIRWANGTVQVSSPQASGLNPFDQSLNTFDAPYFASVNSMFFSDGLGQIQMYLDGTGGSYLGDFFHNFNGTFLGVDSVANTIDLGLDTDASVLASTVSVKSLSINNDKPRGIFDIRNATTVVTSPSMTVSSKTAGAIVAESSTWLGTMYAGKLLPDGTSIYASVSTSQIFDESTIADGSHYYLHLSWAATTGASFYKIIFTDSNSGDFTMCPGGLCSTTTVNTSFDYGKSGQVYVYDPMVTPNSYGPNAYFNTAGDFIMSNGDIHSYVNGGFRNNVHILPSASFSNEFASIYSHPKTSGNLMIYSLDFPQNNGYFQGPGTYIDGYFVPLAYHFGFPNPGSPNQLLETALGYGETRWVAKGSGHYNFTEGIAASSAVFTSSVTAPIVYVSTLGTVSQIRWANGSVQVSTQAGPNPHFQTVTVDEAGSFHDVRTNRLADSIGNYAYATRDESTGDTNFGDPENGYGGTSIRTHPQTNRIDVYASSTTYVGGVVVVSTINTVSRIRWADGTIQVSSPSGGGNPFDQSLNTTNAVQFVNVALSGRIYTDSIFGYADNQIYLFNNGAGRIDFGDHGNAYSGTDIVIDSLNNEINLGSGVGAQITASKLSVNSTTSTWVRASTIAYVNQIRWADGTVQVSSPSASSSGGGGYYMEPSTKTFNFGSGFQSTTGTFTGLLSGTTASFSSMTVTGNMYAKSLNIINPASDILLYLNNSSFLLSNTLTTNRNLFLGVQSGNTSTSGTYDVGIGQYSMQNIAAGSFNVAIGYLSGNHMTSGERNISIGESSLFTNVSGGSNMAIGQNSLYSTTGSENVGIGGSVGFLVTGSDNTMIGFKAGQNNTSGNYNIILGSNINAPVVSGSQQLNIGRVIFGTKMSNDAIETGGSTAFAGGRIGIGTTTPVNTFAVQGGAFFTSSVTASSFYGDGSNLTNMPNRSLFEHYTDSTTAGGTDIVLYSDSIAANTLANNGTKITYRYSGQTDDMSDLKVTIGGSTICALARGGFYLSSMVPWELNGWFIKTGASTGKGACYFQGGATGSNWGNAVSTASATGLDFTVSNNFQLKATQNAGGGTITAIIGNGEMKPNAP